MPRQGISVAARDVPRPATPGAYTARRATVTDLPEASALALIGKRHGLTRAIPGCSLRATSPPQVRSWAADCCSVRRTRATLAETGLGTADGLVQIVPGMWAR